ncbi:MAG: TetR/AcrR family transcriptional regulator [Thermotogota bacterium]|nr:TetR/AcrR family transcriptional regulator [Thermotogota bacterium]
MPVVYDDTTRRKKKEEIIDAAERIFFTKGCGNSSMNDIALEANIAKGTLYIYFETKRDLYYAVGNRALDILVGRFSDIANSDDFENGIEKVLGLARAYINFATDYPDYHRFLIDYHAEPVNFKETNSSVIAAYMKSARICKHLLRCIEEGVADGTIRNDVKPTHLSILLWCKTVGMIELSKLKEPIFKDFAEIEANELIEMYIELERQLISS